MEISAQQLAELLSGIARAQAAVINGMESEFAGIRSGRVVPMLQNVGPDTAAVAKDLERLCKAEG
jgi:hypothetical protein